MGVGRLIAVIVAHPDDAEIGAGGLLALKGGVIVCLTNGHNCTRDVATAREEQEEAAVVLGVDWVHLPNSELLCLTTTLVADLDKILAEHGINTVVTHSANDINQEHRLTAEAVLAASRRIDNVLFFEPIPPAGRYIFNPQMYVDISSVASKKYAAIDKYASQVVRGGRDMMETRMKLDQWRGCEIQVPYAEAYEVCRWRMGDQ